MSALNFDQKRVAIEFCDNNIRCIVLNADDLPFIIRFFRDFSPCRFRNLCDIAGVDFPDRSDRFLVVYQLLSTDYSIRLQVEVVSNELSSVPTITSI